MSGHLNTPSLKCLMPATDATYGRAKTSLLRITVTDTPTTAHDCFPSKKERLDTFLYSPRLVYIAINHSAYFLNLFFFLSVLEALLHSCALLSPIPPHQKLMVVFPEKEKKSQIFFCTALINMAINHAACLNIFLFLSGAGDTVATTPTCGDPYRRTRGRGKSDRV